MKIFKLLFTISILFSLGTVFAHGYRHNHHENRCEPFEGYIQIYPSSRCHILTKKERYFSEQTFLQELGVPGEESCFSGWLEGRLGGQWINGEVISGFTASANDPASIVTAATGIKIFDSWSGRKLGRIFTLDSIYDPQGDTHETLSMVAGTKSYRGSVGNFQVHGNALYGAPVSGELCFGGYDYGYGYGYDD